MDYSSLEGLSDEVLLQIYYEVPLESLSQLCQSNSNLARFCKDKGVRVNALTRYYNTKSVTERQSLYFKYLTQDTERAVERLEILSLLEPSLLTNALLISKAYTVAALLPTHWLLTEGIIYPGSLLNLIDQGASGNKVRLLLQSLPVEAETIIKERFVIVQKGAASRSGRLNPSVPPERDLEVTKPLLEYGADPSAIIADGYCALSILSSGRDMRAWMTVYLALQYLEDLSLAEKAKCLDQALALCIETSGSPEIFALLVAAGADPHSIEAEGYDASEASRRLYNLVVNKILTKEYVETFRSWIAEYYQALPAVKEGVLDYNALLALNPSLLIYAEREGYLTDLDIQVPEYLQFSVPLLEFSLLGVTAKQAMGYDFGRGFLSVLDLREKETPGAVEAASLTLASLTLAGITRIVTLQEIRELYGMTLFMDVLGLGVTVLTKRYFFEVFLSSTYTVQCSSEEGYQGAVYAGNLLNIEIGELLTQASSTS